MNRRVSLGKRFTKTIILYFLVISAKFSLLQLVKYQFIIILNMTDSILLDNPYAKLYEQCTFQQKYSSFQRKDAEDLIRHIGFMYNVFGQAIKDFVKIVSSRFDQAQIKKVMVNSPKFLMKKNPRESKSQSESSEQGPTQHPRRKKQAPKQQKSKGSQTINKNKLQTIRQYPRAVNHDNFDLDFMGSEINEMKQELKAQAEKQEHKNNFNFNNLSRFQSQFPKSDLPQQPTFVLNNQQIGNSSLLSWTSKQNKQISTSINSQSKRISVNIPEKSQENSNLNQSYQDGKVETITKQQFEDNSGVRIAGARKKKDRQKLLGVSCLQCKEYYKAMQLDGQKYCECTSRHRTNRPTRKIKQQFTQQFDLQ